MRHAVDRPKIRPIRVFDLDRRSFLRGYMAWVVAFIAIQPGVLALQQISCFLVIKRLNVPLDEGKIFAVMLGVAAGAFLAGAGRNVVSRVQPRCGREPGGDFSVAVQTLQRGLPAKLMATRAIGRSIQRLMGPRKRSGGDLSPQPQRKTPTRTAGTKRCAPPSSEARARNCSAVPAIHRPARVALEVPSRSYLAIRPR